LPNYIEVDLSELQIGHSIHLSQLNLPKGVESTQLRAGDDFVVATIPIPRAEAEKEDEAEAAAAAAASAAAAAVATPGAAEKGDKDKKEEKKEGDKK
jgi:large subunit ribosomal protein L25